LVGDKATAEALHRIIALELIRRAVVVKPDSQII
jgi:hypothetical protein